MLTFSTRISAFSYSIGVLADDMARNFTVIGGPPASPARSAPRSLFSLVPSLFSLHPACPNFFPPSLHPVLPPSFSHSLARALARTITPFLPPSLHTSPLAHSLRGHARALNPSPARIRSRRTANLRCDPLNLRASTRFISAPSSARRLYPRALRADVARPPNLRGLISIAPPTAGAAGAAGAAGGGSADAGLLLEHGAGGAGVADGGRLPLQPGRRPPQRGPDPHQHGQPVARNHPGSLATEAAKKDVLFSSHSLLFMLAVMFGNRSLKPNQSVARSLKPNQSVATGRSNPTSQLQKMNCIRNSHSFTFYNWCFGNLSSNRPAAAMGGMGVGGGGAGGQAGERLLGGECAVCGGPGAGGGTRRPVGRVGGSLPPSPRPPWRARPVAALRRGAGHGADVHGGGPHRLHLPRQRRDAQHSHRAGASPPPPRRPNTGAGAAGRRIARRCLPAALKGFCRARACLSPSPTTIAFMLMSWGPTHPLSLPRRPLSPSILTTLALYPSPTIFRPPQAHHALGAQS